ncbi:hypothetical protein CLAIMM_01191 isoform 2 [Cladophialophora immunda]|nr:hypothetical protein CLAIMM_01191 isoform 2 [Cladophialophora immunda]
MTSHEWVQFTIGRIIAYCGVGLVENAVPSYQAEIAPASLRGFISGSLICLATLGAMWGAGMGQAMSGYTTRAGWLIPVGVQLIPAVILLLSVPFTVESPRWLVLHNKKERALQNLNRLRPKNMVENGATAAEIDAIDYAIESSHAEKQGSWLDLFRGTYLRRTIICSLLFWFHESTGQQFVNSYGPTFFKQIGLGSAAFTYSLVAQACGVAGALICILVVDRVGRRPILITGQALAALFNFLVAGYGSKLHPTTAQGNLVIASIILLFTACKFSVNTLAFLAVAEIGGVKMRKKILSFATSVDVLSAFIVTFCIPYLLGSPGANLGPKLGWLLGGDSILAVIFAVFFFPELAGRSLEEVDELFEARLWAWQFKFYETSGIGRRIAVLEEHNTNEEKVIMVSGTESGQGRPAYNFSRSSNLRMWTTITKFRIRGLEHDFPTRHFGEDETCI